MTIQETIINLMLEQDYIDSAEQMKAIDDWHYLVQGEMRLWLKKEDFLAAKFNEALETAGYNIAVSVQLNAKDDDSFIIDLSQHESKPYYGLVLYNTHYNSYDSNVQISRNSEAFYAQVIQGILDETSDLEERMDRIRDLLEFNSATVFDIDYTIVTLRPEHLLKDHTIMATEGFLKSDDMQIINRDDYTDDDWEIAVDNFYDEGLNLFYLSL